MESERVALKGLPVEQLFAVICMSEAPIAHWSMLCSSIPGRMWNFALYGLVFSKDWARTFSFNPVWYLNTLAGQIGSPRPSTSLRTLRSMARRWSGAIGETLRRFASTTLKLPSCSPSLRPPALARTSPGSESGGE